MIGWEMISVVCIVNSVTLFGLQEPMIIRRTGHQLMTSQLMTSGKSSR